MTSCLRRIFIKPDEVGPILNKTLDPTFKGGIMVTLSKILYMNQLHFKEYSFYICKVTKNDLITLFITD